MMENAFLVFYTVLGTILSLIALFIVICIAAYKQEDLTPVNIPNLIKWIIGYSLCLAAGLYFHLTILIICSVITLITIIIGNIIIAIKCRKK